MTKQKGIPDWPTLRQLAVKASCDPRTVRAVAEGRLVRGLAGERARDVLVEAGYDVPVPNDEEAAE